ncbi:acyl-CoA/acyl-ACP dehydrogenase [Pseudomaricurvus alkylphenolicus]|uniref:acyl-CoA dehydrogenase family protein n=1 Tax=Pseudomaricurvus alkylphenolicus TaxID=1306991 RepID=UPI001423DB95|nr:acyl-CoA dehydrogenase family protein [Pseudomaricurvus alkylphenolicus]NIB41033.1 acyl-CoA/acyl-ACP dehydrogenase [Pseudomaricurvus alkylphenolicus]
MDFAFTEDQLMIQELAEKIIADRCHDEFQREFAQQPQRYDPVLWSRLAEAGLLGLNLPENCGGMALGFAELCLLLQAQGKHLGPAPLYATLVLGALPIAKFGSTSLQQRYLPEVATGKCLLSALVDARNLQRPKFQAEVTDDGWNLNGICDAVPFGVDAHCFVVPVSTPQGIEVLVVDADVQGISRWDQRGAQAQARVQLENVHVGKDARINEEGKAADVLAWWQPRILTALSAIQVGVATEALRRTAEYTGERKQFGKPVASFQAVAHRAADAYMDIEAMSATLWQAVWRLDQELEAAREVHTAKWWACEGGHRIAHTAQHLHGGMGADVDYPIHRFFLWAKQLEFNGGGASVQLSNLGCEIANRPADFT